VLVKLELKKEKRLNLYKMKLIFKNSRTKKAKKKPVKVSFFKPVKLNTKWNIRNIKRKNLTWSQATIRYPKLNPFKDSDKDGKLNIFDCKPFNKKKHGTSKLLMKEISEEVMRQKGLSMKYINKRKKQLHRELKEKHPKGYKKHIGKTSKVISPKEIVRILAKDPTLYSEYKKNKVRITSSGSDIKRLQGYNAVYFPANEKYKDEEVEYKSTQPLKENMKMVLKHELMHVKQPTREMKEEQKIIEKETGRKLKYEESPREIEAHEDEDLPTEKDIAKSEGPKPETLQSLKDELMEDL